jgi:hypothetical protein
LSKYPGQLDTNAELIPVADNATELAAEHINALRDAIFAIERTLGINPHGSAADLTTRLDQTLNPDGTFKAAALVAAGLIALPITNAMIGSAAAISESKLDLDVGTQALQNQISSNDIDIAYLQSMYNALVVTLSNHVSGTAQRHDGYHIDIAGGLESAPSITTVGQALEFIYNALLVHKSSSATGQHPASAISYAPDVDSPITATDVQGAISQIDTAYQEDRRIHNDSAHGNGVISDGYSAHGGQAGSSAAALVTSRYQPTAGRDQIKIGHINAASIKTRNLNPLALSPSAQSLDFEVQIGTSTRTLSVTGLHTAQYPTTNDRFPVKALVEHLNASFANTANHFPLQAYDAGDGEIVIQHNIARPDCTVKVKSPIINSAMYAFGFTDIDNITAPYLLSTQAYIDGYQFTALATVYSGTITLSAPSSILNLHTLVGAGGLDLKPGNLVHIFNHSSSAAAGTYSISAVGPPPSTQINLATTVAAGTFDCIIYRDTAHLGASSNPRSVDVIIDSHLQLSVVDRYVVTLAPISGIDILEVSDNFPSGTGLLQLTTGSTNSLQLTVNAAVGAATTFPSGFIGLVKVYAADGINYITCLVTSASLIAITSSIAFYSNEIDDTQMKLASTYFDGGLVVSIPIDKTPRGTVGAEQLSTAAIHEFATAYGADILVGGVIRGLSTTDISATELTIAGGRALVAGKLVDFAEVTIDVFNKIASDGTWNLTINENAKLEIFNDSYPGYSLSDIVNSGKRIAIAQFTTLSGNISTVSDARFFINSLPFKYVPTLSATTTASFASIQASQLYASYPAMALPQKLIITSDYAATDALVTAADKLLEFLGDATFTTLSVGQRSIVNIKGNTAATSITLQDGATLNVGGVLSVTGQIILGSNCTLQINSSASLDSVIITGSNSSIIGNNYASIVFTGATDPCISIQDGYNTISNITLSLPNNSNASIIALQHGYNRNVIRDCQLIRLGTIGSWANANRIGIKVAGAAISADLAITNVRFNNLYTGISFASTSMNIENTHISDCVFENCSNGILANKTNGLVVESNTFKSIYDRAIDLAPSGINSLHTYIAVHNNSFASNYAGGLGACLRAGSKLDSCTIIGNTFYDITSAADTIDLQYSFILDTPAITVSGNIFTNCSVPPSSSGYLINYNGVDSSLILSNNIIWEHDGYVLKALGPASISGNMILADTNIINNYVALSIGGDYDVIFQNNYVELSDYHSIESFNAIISSNYISAGAWSILSVAAKDIITDNYIVLSSTSTATPDSLSLYYSSTSQDTALIADNIIDTYAPQNGIRVSGDGNIVFAGNIISPRSPCINLMYLEPHSSTGTRTNIYGNTFNSNLISTGNVILNEKHSTHIHNNLINASASSPTTASINISGSLLTNISVNGNIVGNTAAPGARKILSNSTKDVYIINNKNAEFLQMYSALDGLSYNTSSGAFATSAWALNTGGRYLTSSGTTSGLAVPLNNLQIGSTIVSCTIYANCSVNASLTAQLWARDIGVGTPAIALSGAVSNVGTGALQITATAYTPPTENPYVSPNREYFVTISSTAASNQVGNIGILVYC